MFLPIRCTFLAPGGGVCYAHLDAWRQTVSDGCTVGGATCHARQGGHVSGIEGAIFQAISNWYLTTGYLGIVLAMALESCCIPLPSEIVMPLAGFFVATHPDQFSLIGVGVAGAIGCLVGSLVAYAIGASGGRPLLLKYGRYILISQADSDRADRWFAHYGAPVAFFSRLLPVVRTYISLPAGISRMDVRKFALFTVLGSLPWTFVLAYVGYRLGPSLQSKMSQMGTIFHGVDALIIVLILVAVVLYVRRHLKHDAEARATAAAQTPSAHPQMWQPPQQQAQPWQTPQQPQQPWQQPQPPQRGTRQ